MEQEVFDIQTGMDVHGADGQRIGTVAEIAGFGSAEIAGFSDQGTEELVTQAQAGTGYFKVDRSEDGGRRGATALVVPFNGIAEVSLDRGVTLNAMIMETLRQQREEPLAAEKLYQPKGGRRWWSFFLLP